MEEKDYLKDIQDIRSMMAQSSQFISLSGLSGILAGIYALIGAFIANFLIENDRSYYITYDSPTFQLLILIALGVLFLSVVTAYLLTVKKAKKLGEQVWNPTSRRLIVNFSIPLATGGIFTLLMLKNGYFLIIAPITLIFYGLACVNASKYTLRDVRYLGITQIVLGLIAIEFPGYGLHFWAVGFGICHILYGSIMHYKYDIN
ncbi:MAG: hypothetical protein J0L86_11260 [Flavobacteriales bacterium]|nr:hypothetical protein [Flavobacteriales bacterium]